MDQIGMVRSSTLIRLPRHLILQPQMKRIGNMWIPFFLTANPRVSMVFFFPAYVGYAGSNQGWMPELVANGAAKSQAYGNWIANRYKNQKNIVWMLLGDMGNFTSARERS